MAHHHYYGIVPLGWYVVKAIRVERYETLFTDYDEEGREARYYKFCDRGDTGEGHAQQYKDTPLKLLKRDMFTRRQILRLRDVVVEKCNEVTYGVRAE